MPPLGSVADILWVAGGAVFTVVLAVAVIIWIAREQPVRDDTLAGIPIARPSAPPPTAPPRSDQTP